MTQDNTNTNVNAPRPGVAAPPPANAQQLREDIAKTRSALSEDVKALGDKLNPERLKQDVKEVIHHARDVAREGAKDIVHDAKAAAVDSLRGAKDHAIESISEGVTSVGRRARAATHTASEFTVAHAIPLSIVGAGLGWLLLSLSLQRKRQTPDSGVRRGRLYEGSPTPGNGARSQPGMAGRAADAIEDARDRVVEGAHAIEARIVDGAGELRDKVTHGAAQLGQGTVALSRRTYASVGRMGTRALEFCGDNPLAIALIAIASGTALGMLLPSTRRENLLLGDTRDKLVERVQHSATDLKDSLEHKVGEVREVIDAVRQPSSHA